MCKVTDLNFCRVYILFAPVQFQPYSNVSSFCKDMNKSRVPRHGLKIEASRWVRINSSSKRRKSTLCNVMEDEYHLVTECRRYTYLRKKYIPKYYSQMPSMYKCVYVINPNNNRDIKNLGTYTEQKKKKKKKTKKKKKKKKKK